MTHDRPLNSTISTAIRRLLCVGAILLSARPVAAADDDKAFANVVRPLFNKHCLACHGEDADEGRLRLDKLPPELAAPQHFGKWLSVYEKLKSGEMPPRSRPRPNDADLNQSLTSLEEGLRSADAQRQRTQGRVGLRRLNRVEYQNTIRDLLAVDVDLKDMLPEDASAQGFDNVADALGISPILMERYLDAAETAVRTAMALGPKPQTVRRRYSYKDEGATKRNLKRFVVKDDAVVFFSSGFSPTVLKQFQASAAGLYRVRISAYGYQTDKPAIFRVYAGKVALAERDGKSHLAGHFEVAPAKPTVVEFVDRLAAGDTLKIIPYDTISDVSHITAPKYKGPGVAIQWVEVEGPLGAWPPESRRRLFDVPDEKAAREASTLADAEQILRHFMPHAFRRPITDDDLKPYIALVRVRLADGLPFEKALAVALKGVLCSPHFLFLREQPGKLSDDAVASRLSYFLWSSMPDPELFDLARKGKLREPAVLRGQVERMLGDSKARALTENFVGQWLGLRLIDDTTPDKKLYPEFDEFLKVSMVRESELFFEELLKNDLSVLNVVDSDFSILNERLAQHYGIAGVKGLEFRKVKLPAGSGRGGVLTQAAVLKVTANGTTTSPVLRGTWVLRNIVGRPPPPPPPNVPAVEPDIRGATNIREQLAKHRNNAACASCHAKIDPPGFALEGFDVIGGKRDVYRTLGAGPRLTTEVKGKRVPYGTGAKVDTSGVLPDGKRFADISEYKRLLLQDKEQIVRCLTEKLVVYSTGGAIRFADGPVIDAMVVRARDSNYGLRSLIHEIVESPIFLNK